MLIYLADKKVDNKPYSLLAYLHTNCFFNQFFPTDY